MLIPRQPVGALVASGACRGGLNYGGNTSWLIPIWLQAMFPGLLVLGVFFLPESPRWLYVNGKMEQAKATMAYYHGNGNPESEWVKLQLAEYESHLELDGADKRWWDYRALFKSVCICCKIPSRKGRTNMISVALISIPSDGQLHRISLWPMGRQRFVITLPYPKHRLTLSSHRSCNLLPLRLPRHRRYQIP